MDLSPIDIEQKAFTQALRGYQMDEVDDFLDEVVATLRTYDQRLRDAQDKIRALEADAASRGGDETTISRAILAAQRSADALLAEAQGEAERIRQTAIAETDKLTAEHNAERSRLLGEIDGMRDHVSDLRKSLSALASNVGAELDRMDADLKGAESDVAASGQSMTRPVKSADVTEPPSEAETVESPIRRVDLSESADDFSEDSADDEPKVSRVGVRPWERG